MRPRLRARALWKDQRRQVAVPRQPPATRIGHANQHQQTSRNRDSLHVWLFIEVANDAGKTRVTRPCRRAGQASAASRTIEPVAESFPASPRGRALDARLLTWRRERAPYSPAHQRAPGARLSSPHRRARRRRHRCLRRSRGLAARRVDRRQRARLAHVAGQAGRARRERRMMKTPGRLTNRSVARTSW